ncbi:MAG: iron ABC transporter permease [Actinobacteria bacterium]|nr:iron ABC transporter permease [Actinomycetota bacterium]
MITSFELLLTTAFIAVVSAALSAFVGVPVGFWLSSISPRLGRIVSAVLTVPFLLPPFLIGIAINAITRDLTINSTIGIFLILAAHTIMNAGFIARIVATRTVGSELVDAAEIEGASRLQIRTQIELPQLLSAVASGAVLVALYSATSYGLILTLSDGQVRTLETQIAISALQRLDLETAGQLALMQTLLSIAMFLSVRKFAAIDSSLTEIQTSRLRAGWPSRFIGLGFLAAVLFTLGSVLNRSNWGDGLLTNLGNLASKGTRSMLNISILEAAGNSLRNALVVAIVVVPIALFMARKKAPSLLAVMPAGISPVVFGLATLAIVGYLPRELTSSWLLLPLVQVLFALPITYQILHPARNGFDSEQREAASLDGANWLNRFWWIEFPQIRKAVLLATTFAMLTSLGEFGAASFLAFGSNETLPLVMFQLFGRPGGDNYGMLMVAASSYILLTAFIVYLVTLPERNRNPRH